jgi:hypothetical protein
MPDQHVNGLAVRIGIFPSAAEIRGRPNPAALAIATWIQHELAGVRPAGLHLEAPDG